MKRLLPHSLVLAVALSAASAPAVSRHSCTFLDGDGRTVRVQEGIAANGFAVAPELETEAETLAGWSVGGRTYSRADFAALPITSNTVARAVMAARTFTVRFLDSDGVKVLKTCSVAYGADAVPPNPSKSGFAFVRWDRPYTGVRRDLRVKAVWRGTASPSTSYDVTTYSYGGIVMGWGAFSPLVPDDPSAASANAQNLNAMIGHVKSGEVLYFPKGVYYVDKRIDIGAYGITLWGDRAEIVRTGVSNTNSTPYAGNAESGSDYNWASFMVVAASDVTLRGLTFRYAVPTSFTAEILTDRGDGSQRARLVDGRDADFNADLRFQRVNSFDATGRPLGLDLVYGAGTTAGTHYKAASKFTTEADGTKTFDLWLGKNCVKAGERVALCCSTAYSQGLILYGAKETVSDIVLEDVTVANCFSMAMVVKRVKNLTLRRFRVADDTPGAIYAAGMDGIHVAGLGGKLTMEECELRGLADDMLNVHATAGVVGSVSGTKVTLSREVEAVAFNKGDTVKFYTAKLADLGTAKVTASTTTSVTVDALPAGVAANALIGNETFMPEVEISGCRFGVTRARGVLLQSDAKITVKDSEFHDTRLAGMLLSPSATGQWTEMGPIRDALVTNCVFEACGVAEASTGSKNNGAIVIRCDHDSDGSAGSFDVAANRNVRIVANRFRDCVSAGVFAADTTGLVVQGNEFRACGGRVAGYDDRIVRVEYCADVQVKDNVTYDSPFVAALVTANSSGCVSSGNSIWYDVRFVDENGTLLEKGRARYYYTLEEPGWSRNLTAAGGVFSHWRTPGADGAYAFDARVNGPFTLECVYAPVADPAFDIPGAAGGVNARVDPATGRRYVAFGAPVMAGGRLTLSLSAAEIVASGDAYRLVCKTDLASDETFTLPARLTGSGESGVITVDPGAAGYPTLFILGLAPAE